MAVKATVMVRDCLLDSNAQMWLVLKINTGTEYIESVTYGPVAPDISNVTLNANILAFAKQYAIDNWATFFDLLDSVRLIQLTSPLS